jgi:hypothetical protein
MNTDKFIFKPENINLNLLAFYQGAFLNICVHPCHLWQTCIHPPQADTKICGPNIENDPYFYGFNSLTGGKLNDSSIWL